MKWVNARREPAPRKDTESTRRTERRVKESARHGASARVPRVSDPPIAALPATHDATHVHMHMHMHTCTHAHAHMHMHTCTCTAHICTCTYPHAHDATRVHLSRKNTETPLIHSIRDAHREERVPHDACAPCAFARLRASLSLGRGGGKGDLCSLLDMP